MIPFPSVILIPRYQDIEIITSRYQELPVMHNSPVNDIIERWERQIGFLNDSIPLLIIQTLSSLLSQGLPLRSYRYMHCQCTVHASMPDVTARIFANLDKHTHDVNFSIYIMGQFCVEKHKGVEIPNVKIGLGLLNLLGFKYSHLRF